MALQAKDIITKGSFKLSEAEMSDILPCTADWFCRYRSLYGGFDFSRLEKQFLLISILCRV